MGQIDVTDAWLYKYMSIVDEAIINEIEKNVDYDLYMSMAAFFATIIKYRFVSTDSTSCIFCIL